MKDYLLTATDKGGNVRIKVMYAKDLVETARQCHDTYPVCSAALGRTLVMTAMIGSTMKNKKDKATVIIKGDGPLEGITTTVDSDCKVKGYVVNPCVDIPLNEKNKLDVKGAVGNGHLTIIKDLGLKEPYSGRIDLVSGELAEDFTYYFTKSEQVPSAIGLGVLVDTDASIRHAGGFWLSVLPDCDEDILTKIENNLNEITAVTKIFDEGKTCEDILDMIFADIEYNVLSTVYPEFKCDCSKDKVAEILSIISKEELKDIIETDKKAEVSCQFCGKKYNLNEKELKNIYEGVRYDN